MNQITHFTDPVYPVCDIPPAGNSPITLDTLDRQEELPDIWMLCYNSIEPTNHTRSILGFGPMVRSSGHVTIP